MKQKIQKYFKICFQQRLTFFQNQGNVRVTLLEQHNNFAMPQFWL